MDARSLDPLEPESKARSNIAPDKSYGGVKTRLNVKALRQQRQPWEYGIVPKDEPDSKTASSLGRDALVNPNSNDRFQPGLIVWTDWGCLNTSISRIDTAAGVMPGIRAA